MKPFKLFLFFAVIMLVLGIFSWITPKEGWQILGLEIQFLKFNTNSPSNDSIDFKALDYTIKYVPYPSTNDTLNIDSIKVDASGLEQLDSIIMHFPEDLAKKNTYKDTSLFWATFKNAALNMASTDKQIRILYYGDSQIENDRITSSLRKILQAKYGGSGRGLVPIIGIYNTANNFIMSVSNNWEKVSVVGNKRKNLDAGLMCESYKITNPKNSKDSLVGASIKIKTINTSKKDGYSLLRIYYRSNQNSFLEVVKNGKSVHAQKLEPNQKLNELKLNFGGNPHNLELKFQTDSELHLYGISLESPNGVQVDNIALRGKSTPEFTRLDTNRFNQMANLLKPTFIIMHYGVNVVPNVRNNYGFYKKILSDDISFLKQNLPNVPILLISTSDMAQRVKGELVSFSNIPEIVKAQESAALQNNCAFWNLYETMGGKGSMISWVEKIPPLGNKDYVHFTPLGASEVGKLLSILFIESAMEPIAEGVVENEY